MFDVMTRIWRRTQAPREQHENKVEASSATTPAPPADAKPAKAPPKTLFSVDVGNYS